LDYRYSDWLRQTVKTASTCSTKLSELRRVEAAYGDLDELFDKDELSSVLEELTYSSADSRDDRENPSKIVINGDIRNNLASYKSAVSKYVRFREDIESSAAQAISLQSKTSFEIDRSEAESAQAFSLEKDLQAALRKNITQIEDGLEIVDGNAEKKVDSGFIDILAKDNKGQMVVIELKAVKARRDVIGQILAYMGDISDEWSESNVRGILIAPEFDSKVIAASRMVPNLTLKKYCFSFSFKNVE